MALLVIATLGNDIAQILIYKDVYSLSQILAFGLLHVLNTAIIYSDYITKAYA